MAPAPLGGRADRDRRPLVLARRRSRDRSAPPLPGIPRLRSGPAAEPRPERGVAGRARPLRTLRGGGLRGAVHELRHTPGSPKTALRGIPRDWDFVLHHPAASDPNEARFEGLQRYYAASRRHFRARVAVGVAGREPPAYAPHQELRLVLPEEARAAARHALDRRRSIAVMPAGSASLRALYPSVTSWIAILDELERRFPDAVFTFVGRLQQQGGRTVSGITRAEVGRLVGSRCRAIDVFDRPILDQLAAVEASGLFVSPHTGFGFAAVSVGTPWLTLAGGDWHEYFFNGVPFYSVLPKSRAHPAFVHSRTLPMIEADSDGEGPRTATMSAVRIREDLDEIGEAAAMLVEGRLSYEDALAGYFPRLVEAYGGDRSQVVTFEDVHLGYV